VQSGMIIAHVDIRGDCESFGEGRDFRIYRNICGRAGSFREQSILGIGTNGRLKVAGSNPRRKLDGPARNYGMFGKRIYLRGEMADRVIKTRARGRVHLETLDDKSM
jgi:hypothetical protein